MTTCNAEELIDSLPKPCTLASIDIGDGTDADKRAWVYYVERTGNRMAVCDCLYDMRKVRDSKYCFLNDSTAMVQWWSGERLYVLNDGDFDAILLLCELTKCGEHCIEDFTATIVDYLSDREHTLIVNRSLDRADYT